MSNNILQQFKQAKREITQPQHRQELFSMSITAATVTGGNPMDEQQFLIDLVFKPKEPGLKLRIEETQLLLAYIGEILKEIEAEENKIIAEQTAAE
jgi:hypothetical protein